MAHPTTVLVLTPGTGGYYFGEVLAGLAREVAGAGGRLVLVQTPAPDSRGEQFGSAADFFTPVAWSEVDGAVVIKTEVGASYLKRLREDGKAIVLASTGIPDFEAPIAMPNNHEGIFSAVEHLIGHGHTRIGFVGCLVDHDIRERHTAFLEALENHDLTLDPRFVYAASDNGQIGGILAARNLLASAHRPTALMIATDHNAIGVMGTLTDAGLVIPRDIAVVGYDNTDAGSFSTPTLSSVNQRFDEVGALAGRLVLAQMRGETVPYTAFTSPSVVLAVRNSCGCGVEAPTVASRGDEWLLAASPELLRDELQDVLCGALLTGAGVIDSPLRDTVLATVHEAERLLQAGDDVTSAEIGSLTKALRLLTSRPDTLRRITAAMIEYVERIGSAGASAAGSRGAGGPNPGAAARIAAPLWRLQAGAFLRQAESIEAALEEQYVVDAGLIDPGRSDPRHLDWLAGTHVSAGVLALWEDFPSSGQLRIVGIYDSARLLPDLLGTVTTPQAFPPTALIGAAQPSERGVCVVVPVRTKEREWGLLAVVGAIDTTSAGEIHRHWAALLCASLESERLQKAVRASEERYSLMTRATNDGLWEWEASTGNVYLSDRCTTLLGLEPGGAEEERLRLWQALVHPDDREEMDRGVDAAVAGPQETVNSQYRLRTADGSYRWMLARAIGVRSETGQVKRIVGSLSDIHERRSLEDQLRENALYDAVTGLPNRRLFLDRLERSVALWQRSGTPFAVIFLDLDGFKLINDSLGHQTGDRVLTAVGARIQSQLRAVDTGARFGGDEFAILLHDLEDTSVARVAERVQASLAAAMDVDGHELSIRASLGIATSAMDNASAEDVLRDADTAMYHAKETERGTVSFFDTAMHDRAVQEQTLHIELRKALEEHQFEVHYQPIVNLASGRTDRFEALVRWRHPSRGLLLPAEFLTIMQDAGLIVRLGRWIVDEVCRQLAAWGPDVLNVSINISDREFWHSGLLPMVLESLRRHGITPDRLTLEITEGVIMRRPEEALRLMLEMHDAGLLLHLDDFGTGYSSLETLHRFPVDAFKIDRSFIRGLATGDRRGELVRAIVAMGKALGLAMVAEGIETEAQLTFLREVGCVTGQGFLFMPAVAGKDAPDLLERTLGGSPKSSSDARTTASKDDFRSAF